MTERHLAAIMVADVVGFWVKSSRATSRYRPLQADEIRPHQQAQTAIALGPPFTLARADEVIE